MISLSNVTKVYNKSKPSEVYALNNLNLNIENTGLVLICGESGCGKTTLLNILSKMDSPTEGEVITDFEENYGAFIFQDLQLIEDYSVGDNLKLVIELYDVEDKIDDYLKEFDLYKFKNNMARELSGGQKQRIGIIRALLMKKTVIFCDEPTGALDKENAIAISKILKDISKDKLVIIVSHDEPLFSPLADRIIKLCDGEIVEDSCSTLENTNVVENTSKAKELKIPFKTVMKFSNRNIKKAPLRFILSILSLIISLSIIILSINVLSVSEAKSRNNIYNENGVVYMDFLMNDTSSDNGKYGITRDEYDNLQLKYNDAIRYVDYTLDSNYLNNARTYLTDSTDYEILCGTNKVLKNEIIISDFLAYNYIEKKLLNITPQELINSVVINDLKIVGIYKTDFNIDLIKGDIDKLVSFYDVYHQSIFMTNETFRSITDSNSFVILTLVNDEYKTPNYVLNEDLEGNNVKVSKTIFDQLGNFTISYYNEKYYQRGYDRKEKTLLELNSIGEAQHTNSIECSKELYDSIFLDSYINIYLKYGVSILNYNSKNIDYLMNNDYVFDTDFEIDIDNAKAFNKRAGILEISFGSLLLIVTITLIYNYIMSNYIKNKREIGILMSLWINKKKIKLFFMPDALIIIFVSTILSIVVSAVGVTLQNYLLIRTKYTCVNYLYYQFFPFLIVLLVVILITYLVLLIVFNKIRKQSIIQLIYDK